MSSEVTMKELEVLRSDLQRIGMSRAREEPEAKIRQGKERQQEMVTVHLQEVAELVRFREELQKCSEDCEKKLENKIRLTMEILTNASEPPAVCDHDRLGSIKAQIMQTGDEVCSEASTSFTSAELCEDAQSSEVDSDSRFDYIEIAKGERGIALDQDIHRLAIILFSTTKKQPFHIHMNDYIHKLWTELSPQEKRTWHEIAVAVKKTASLESSFMAPDFEDINTKLSIPRCEEESLDWNDDKKKRRDRGKGWRK